jgi:hypothetical protein
VRNLLANELVPPTALYQDYHYNDPATSVFNSGYTNVLAATGDTPIKIRVLACNSRSQGVPTAFLLLHQTNLKLVHVYTQQLNLFNPSMGLPATPWDDAMLIGKGDLYNNHQVLV